MHVIKLNQKGIDTVKNMPSISKHVKSSDGLLSVGSVGQSNFPWAVELRDKDNEHIMTLNHDLIDFFYADKAE